MLRVLKPLGKRTVVVFLVFLLYSATRHFFDGPDKVFSVAVIDRKYQQTLDLLQDRPRKKLEMYVDHSTKTGFFVANSDSSLCLTVSTTIVEPVEHVTLQSCAPNSTSQMFTINHHRDPAIFDSVSLADKCFDFGRGIPLILWECHGRGSQDVSYDYTAGMIYHTEQNMCIDSMEVVEGGDAKVTRCSLLEETQKWIFNVAEAR